MLKMETLYQFNPPCQSCIMCRSPQAELSYGDFANNGKLWLKGARIQTEFPNLSNNHGF